MLHLKAAEAFRVVLHLEAEVRQEEVAHPVLRQRQVPDAVLLAAKCRQRLWGHIRFQSAAAQ